MGTARRPRPVHRGGRGAAPSRAARAARRGRRSTATRPSAASSAPPPTRPASTVCTPGCPCAPRPAAVRRRSSCRSTGPPTSGVRAGHGGAALARRRGRGARLGRGVRRGRHRRPGGRARDPRTIRGRCDPAGLLGRHRRQQAAGQAGNRLRQARRHLPADRQNWYEVLGTGPPTRCGASDPRPSGRLAGLGIGTVRELAAADPRALAAALGPATGPWLIQIARGLPPADVTGESPTGPRATARKSPTRKTSPTGRG